MVQKLKGFTLIELIVVIGIIAILAGIVILAVNPNKQFGQARDAQRRSDTLALLDAIYQNATDHNGILSSAVTAATTASNIGTNSPACTPACVDLTADLVTAPNNYLSAIPQDPGGPGKTAGTAANTQYTVLYTAATKRVTVAAPNVEQTTAISVTR